MNTIDKIKRELYEIMKNNKPNENLTFCYGAGCSKIRYMGEWHDFGRKLTSAEEGFLSSGICQECSNKTEREIKKMHELRRKGLI